MAVYKLVLIRHGESNWNQENRFCGWFDADLSETGEKEAKRGGQALKGEEAETRPLSYATVMLSCLSCDYITGCANVQRRCLYVSALHRGGLV